MSLHKLEKVNTIFGFQNYINTNNFLKNNCLFKNLPYISLIQDSLCSYIDHEILFSKHCINKAFILTDDIMLALIEDDENSGSVYNENFNFENLSCGSGINNTSSTGCNHDPMSTSSTAINMSTNEYTSTLLEDAFFIFQKCVCRSINMNDINTICVLINNITIFLSTTFKEYLKDNVKNSKHIYSAFIHDVNNLKNFSFHKLLNSIDKNNYFEDYTTKTITINTNFYNSFKALNENIKKTNMSGILKYELSNKNNKKGITNANLNENEDAEKSNIKGNKNDSKLKVERNIFEYINENQQENLFNPLQTNANVNANVNEKNKNLKDQIINSKYLYPHCLNNIDACYQYVQKYKSFINEYFNEQFLENKKNKKEFQNHTLMFNNSLTNFDNVLKEYEQLNTDNCKVLLNILKVHFLNHLVLIENINFDITSEQYAYYQINDPYINNLISRIKMILHHIYFYFNHNIFNVCIHLMTGKICNYIERILKKKKFSMYGAVQIDNDIRNLMLFFTSLTNINVKKEFSKLFDICELLNVNDIQDFKDLYDENKSNFNFSEIQNILLLRNDLSPGLLSSVKEYINSKMK